MGIDRRDFIKLSATASAVGVVAGCSDDDNDKIIDPGPEPSPGPTPGEEQLNWSNCLCNCGSNCPLMVYSKDGVITRIEGDQTGDDTFGNHQIRACARGRSNRQRVYNPDRLLYPMKRVGERGSGQFERISWEQATQEIGTQLKGIYDSYGPRSVYYMYQSGAYYDLTGRGPWKRMLAKMGGYLGYYGSYSSAQVTKVTPYVYGSNTRSTMLEIANSDLHLFFGYNPLEIRQSGSGEGYEFAEMKRQTGAKTIFVDCRYSDSMMGRQDEYHPCRPGTDAALCEGIAYHLITNNLIDEQFLADKCYGFRAEAEMPDPHDPTKTLPAVAYEDSYEAHILGLGGDGVVKTPEWAAQICGVPADSIRNIAEQLAAAKAPYIVGGYGIQRQINGENNVRAVMTLAMLVGAVGKRGTNNGHMPNSAKALYTSGLPGQGSPEKAKISCYTWTDAIVDGENMTVFKDGVMGLPAEELNANGNGKLGANIKAIINFAGQTLLNQHSECFKTAEILKDTSKCELIIVSENHMTPTAKFADYLLPDSTWLETDDIANQSYSAGAMSCITAMTKAIEPMGECRNSFDVCADIAEVMGVGAEFSEGKTYQQWLEEYYLTHVRPKDESLFPATLEEFQQQGIVKKFTELSEAQCALYDYVQNGGVLKTASGKMEIYSHKLAEIGRTWEVPDYWLDKDNYVTAIAKYIKVPESAEDDSPEIADFPLQLIGHHTKGRTHSSFHSVENLREAVFDAVWVNPADADGYADGDLVIVESRRAKVKVHARLTDRIMPGVTSLPQGAWFNPDGDIDVGGCINTLTSQEFKSPLSKGNPQHTNRVKIYKA